MLVRLVLVLCVAGAAVANPGDNLTAATLCDYNGCHDGTILGSVVASFLQKKFVLGTSWDVLGDCKSITPSRPMCCGINDLYSSTFATAYASVGWNGTSFYSWEPPASDGTPINILAKGKWTRNSFTGSSASQLTICEGTMQRCCTAYKQPDSSFRCTITTNDRVLNVKFSGTDYWNQFGAGAIQVTDTTSNTTRQPFVAFGNYDQSLGYNAWRFIHSFANENDFVNCITVF